MRFIDRRCGHVPVAPTIVTGTLLLNYLSSVRAAQPVSVVFDKFLGYDGQWSVAQIQVGSQNQTLSVLPNTVTSDTWVVGPGACGNLECFTERGGAFDATLSSTWETLGYYDLGDAAPGQAGLYGLETLVIPNTVSASNQSIAVINTTEIWLGSLGLRAQKSELGGHTSSSFLQTLASINNGTPSQSYGYTAGAAYADRRVAGSLTLGGTDTTRYVPSNRSFTLTDLNPILAINQIQIEAQMLADFPSNWPMNPLSLMDATGADAALFTIDSLTPFLWMPHAVCDRFAAALNLTYNNTLDLYVFSNTSTSGPSFLNAWNMTFTFTLAQETTSAAYIEMPISYNAFNLQLSFPFPGLDPNSSVNYFPLRRANSTTQYIIGRSFLQETYLAVDYGRNNFSISRAVLPNADASTPNLVEISAVNNPSPSPTKSASLSTGAKAGIGVGVALGVLAVAALLFLFIRRRKTLQSAEADGTRKHRFLSIFRKTKPQEGTVTELAGDRRQPREMQADASNTRFELPTKDAVEMPAEEVPAAFLDPNRGLVTALNDPDRPVELEQTQNLTEKAIVTTNVASSERSRSPAPPYSPTDDARTGSNSISPNGTNASNLFRGSQSSGEQGISPITPFPHPSLVPLSYDEMARTGLTTSSGPSSHQQSSSYSSSQDRSSVQSSRLSPQQQALLRSASRMSRASRSSRFREELIDDGPSRPPAEDPPKTLRPRFSWEE